MTIEPVIGIQKKDTTISEKEFPSFSIFSTTQMLRDYFQQYGYRFIGFYGGEENLIVVKDNNPELAAMTGEYNCYRVLDYRTGEIVVSNLNVIDALSNQVSTDKTKVFSFTHSIETTPSSMRLICKATSNTVLEAESMRFISPNILLVNNYGLEFIYSLLETRAYPIMKPDPIVYFGKNPEQFVDMRDGMYLTFQTMIKPLYANYINLLELATMYPYGEKIGNRFKLLNYPIRHGIFYKNADFSQTKWYPSLEERDKVLKELGILVENVLEGNYVKIKKD